MCKVFVRPRSDQDGMNERGTATLASSAGKVLADADEWRADFSTSSLTVATGTAAGGPTGGQCPIERSLPTLPSPLLRSLTRVGCFSFSFVRILKPVAWVRSYDRGRERFGLSGFCVSTHRIFACLRYGKDGSMATFDDYGIFVWLSAASSCFSPAFSLVAWVSLEECGDLLSTVYFIFFKVLPVPSSLVYLFLLSVFSFVCFDGIHTSNVLHPPCIPLYDPAPICFTRSYNFAGQQSVR